MSSEDEDEDVDGGDAEEEDVGEEGIVLDAEGGPHRSYEEADDARAEELLAANGIATTRAGLVEVLTGSAPAVLRGAAARTLGARAEMAAVDDLLGVARSSDDLLRAEAAFATARLGVAEGLHLLKKSLAAPVGASLGAPTAAGFLARLGDPSGWPVVRAALREQNFLIRIVGAKQLLYFVPFDGPSADVFAEFGRALDDEEPDVAAAATTQLRQLDHPRAVALLRR